MDVDVMTIIESYEQQVRDLTVKLAHKAKTIQALTAELNALRSQSEPQPESN